MKKVIVFLLMSVYLNTIAQCVQPDLPVISASSTTVCSNQTVTLSIASGSLNNATNWVWYINSCGSNFWSTGSQIVVNLPITATFYVRGEGGCVTPGSCASILINVLQAPSASVINTLQAICGNNNGMASINIINGVPPYSYSWNTNPVQTTSFAINLPAGNFTETVTDAQGCVLNTSVNITSAPLPSVSAVSHNILCSGQNNGSATVTASGVGPFTYAWVPSGLTSAIINGLGASIHSATVTDANGCTTYTTVSIFEPNVLSLNVAPPQTICYGNIASVYAQAGGGTTPYQYTMTNLATNTTTNLITPIGMNAMPTLTTNTTFTVAVLDANGCSHGPSTIIVNVRPPLIAANATVVTCDRDSIVISPSIVSVGNGSPYTYNWINNPTTSYSISVIASLTNTPQNFTVAISDACTIPSTSAVITLSVSACVGIEENKNSDPAISFYPNPVKDILRVECEQLEISEFKIFSLVGKEVLRQDLAQDQNVIDLSEFENSIYFLSFYNKNKKIRTEKIIVQH